MSVENDQALPLGLQLGDYRLDAVIGHGGFGITYRAFDGQLAKMVAIKEYLPIEFAVRRGREVVPRGGRFADDFAWGRERFLDEARALARFRHPHIVPVLRYFEANGTAYTVMEFEDGKSVAELLRKPGTRLPADAAIPTGRLPRRRPTASTSRSWLRSTRGSLLRPLTGRRPSRPGAPCSASRCPSPTTRRPSGWAPKPLPGPRRRGWAASSATRMSACRRSRRRPVGAAA